MVLVRTKQHKPELLLRRLHVCCGNLSGETTENCLEPWSLWSSAHCGGGGGAAHRLGAACGSQAQNAGSPQPLRQPGCVPHCSSSRLMEASLQERMRSSLVTGCMDRATPPHFLAVSAVSPSLFSQTLCPVTNSSPSVLCTLDCHLPWLLCVADSSWTPPFPTLLLILAQGGSLERPVLPQRHDFLGDLAPHLLYFIFKIYFM